MIHEILKILDTTNLQELDKQRITTDLLRLFNVVGRRELLKAFLDWQQNKYPMSYDTDIDEQLNDFEAFNCC